MIQSACEDIDPDELEAFGAPVSGQLVRKSFLFNTDPDEERSFKLSENQQKAFLTNLDIGLASDPAMTIGEAINGSVGAFLKIQITHRADAKDASNIFTEVGATSSAA